jgi:hypothetical protein
MGKSLGDKIVIAIAPAALAALEVVSVEFHGTIRAMRLVAAL